MASITWDEQGAIDRPRREPLDYVDPLIGTAELGNTFPAVCLPFGLAKWTPQTVAGEHKGQPPYNYAHRRIQGIRWTNFISGSAVPDYGSMTVMALVGDLRLHPEERASAFSHAHEIARPYAYAVTLDDYAVRAEVTATERTGFLRFTFPATDAAWVRFVKVLFDRDPSDPRLYHLVLDSTALPLDRCVDLVAEAATAFWAAEEPV